MILLDTDHITHLKYAKGDRGSQLLRKIFQNTTGDVVGITIITVEEQMRGWLASIAKERQVRRQITPYQELAKLFEFFQVFRIAPFDDAAVDRYEQLKASRLRIGTMDLKIASIALAQQALLLSANLKDFEQVPGLRVENWLE